VRTIHFMENDPLKIELVVDITVLQLIAGDTPAKLDAT
jgi:hypothetical protein